MHRSVLALSALLSFAVVPDLPAQQPTHGRGFWVLDDIWNLNTDTPLPTLGALYGTLQEADVAPTSQTLATVAEREKALAGLVARWAALRGADRAALNARLRAAGGAEIR